MSKKLAFVSIFLAFSIIAVYTSFTVQPSAFYGEMIRSAQIMKMSMDVLQNFYSSKNGVDLVSEENDTRKSVLLGDSFNDITTTLGSMDSKLTTINPNFAAYVCKIMKTQGVEAGDSVALNFSSSFPALNIAVLSACEALGADAILMTSLGSSTYGGNRPDFAYLDMQAILNDQNILSIRNAVLSYGGEKDTAVGINKDMLYEIARRNNLYHLIFEEEDFYENISHRLAIYDRKKVKMFINVGGNIASTGISNEVTIHPNGLISPQPGLVDYEKGLIEVYSNRGIPVLNLLDIKSLAVKEGIPVAPDYIQTVGESGVYYEKKYNRFWLFTASLLTLGWLWIYGEDYRKDRQSASRY